MGREKKVELKMKPPPKKKDKKRKCKKKYKNHSNKKYRGRGKANAKRGFFSVLLVNLRGFRSKKFALEKELKRIKTSMVLMNETQLSGNAKVKLSSYTSWSRNMEEQKGGGIATSVSHQYSQSATGAGVSRGNDEFLVTRLESFNPALSVINCYGEQRKTTKQEVEAKWIRLRKEMEAIRTRNDFCLVSADLNKLVGCDELGVPGNHPEVSPGGKLLRELLASRNWFLVNALGEEMVEGGPFTREVPATGRLSCLDLFIVSRELRPYVDKLVIDSERKWKIARSMKVRGKQKLVYSDHFPGLITFNNLPKEKEEKEEKIVRWNLAKDGGWMKYKELTEKYVEAIEEIVENKQLAIEQVSHKFEKVHNKIKFKAFGKVTITNKEKTKNNIEKTKQNEIDSDEVKAHKLKIEQIKRTEEEIQEIKTFKSGRVGQIWEIKKRVVGGKKATMEATSIVDPATGKLVVSKKQIKKVSLQYCKDTLSNNEPAEGFEDEINMKKEKVKEVINSKDGTFEAFQQTFEWNIRKFQKSGEKTMTSLQKLQKHFSWQFSSFVRECLKTKYSHQTFKKQRCT